METHAVGLGGSGNPALNVVTGAFGYTGRYIAERLLDGGESVRTLTNRPGRTSSLGGRIEVAPLDFQNEERLAQDLRGARVLFNTYWVRFAHGNISHKKAVENSRVLIRAAERAGVERIVHVSITNPSLDSPLTYFRGKAQVEQAIMCSKLPYAILRPAVVFGEEDILINNIAWLLRHFPLFAIPGRGDYSLQPIFMRDLAALAVESGHRNDDVVMDAVGPEIYKYRDLVELIHKAVRSRSRVLHLPASWMTPISWLLGRMVHDVVLTKDEVRGLMADLLVSAQPPTGKTSLRSWLQEHAHTVGVKYASELDRHYNPGGLGGKA
jgi:uncharacterized protein YbjT (DUF2867 family)